MSSPPRDELVMKVLVALRVPGTDVADVIQVHRRYLVELMQQWTRIKENESESDMGLALVVDAELFRLDSVIRWLDAADGRIKRSGARECRQRGKRPESEFTRAGGHAKRAAQSGSAEMNVLELRRVSTFLRPGGGRGARAA